MGTRTQRDQEVGRRQIAQESQAAHDTGTTNGTTSRFSLAGMARTGQGRSGTNNWDPNEHSLIPAHKRLSHAQEQPTFFLLPTCY